MNEAIRQLAYQCEQLSDERQCKIIAEWVQLTQRGNAWRLLCDHHKYIVETRLATIRFTPMPTFILIEAAIELGKLGPVDPELDRDVIESDATEHKLGPDGPQGGE